MPSVLLGAFHMQGIKDYRLLLSIYTQEYFPNYQHIHHTSAQKKAPPKGIGKGFSIGTLILSLLLSRLYPSLPHLLLHRLNGHLFPVEDTCGQGGFCLGLLKDL